ncbi:NAD(P)-dependent dehydrogenase, short-chain alcohol dehydrogenase family [Prauserella marina]|uniref:NAD(P)-dependent dehydrogenase, short-chain alcohol dehydrogenase family n=1 Tax=Prauserella marina TaxID=530584 RepID=A0A1G6M5A7_9PSEU|nr:SDR family oxidoreductase [Prauserella marina]PWV85607.1 NAD(P)-dependent dehydrogenase (short-subunit alcohol dehydrogenase family) [Prauserella marina]SDC50611.1 NAD(P)-dependent dehydrogenase, short-chain alcohol dehydrogenase family [Prauserella marina]
MNENGETGETGETPVTGKDPARLWRLDGKVALITGGSRGIGKAAAAMFVKAGAHVALVSRDADRLAETASELRTLRPGAEVRCYQGNAGDPDRISATVEQANTDFGHLDVLVNNAATNPYYGPLSELDLSRARKTTQVNLLGPLLWTQEVWRRSMREHGGAIVNIVSLGAFIAERGVGYYATTKAALKHLTTQFAAELGPTARVNAIAPGLVETDMARVLVEAKGDELAARLPLRRLGTPDDIAAAALFLAGPASSWLTGQTLVVDGGALAMPLAGMDN